VQHIGVAPELAEAPAVGEVGQVPTEQPLASAPTADKLPEGRVELDSAELGLITVGHMKRNVVAMHAPA